ncbi:MULTISPECIES: GFA family protein [Pseudomonas]|uniref:GFA family protein n=1 Tax=Pseudomonas mosselii TaxID=78327 RepID=A0ABX9BA82_9PSED|nr:MULTISPECIES: GFA family protein [Pseudomonas]MCL8302666.1 GFA family protein [Pseudomonas mosselii]MCL8340904.1 GFA family protein [Pseudomonas mosselii]MCU9530570.1 GFA family protein [Pseudomonas mosselii]MCU9535789.1 GFA family protein [Pseudomonas mosselii]MCU9547556.1 GFA family protein [Pseudomonas mosselii]
MTLYKGGCLCGRIRFTASGEPRFPHTCSCGQCQRHSGSLTLCWVEFDNAAVVWTGEGGLPALYRSSEGSSRAFCATCGSSLGAIDDAPTVALLLGCFDAKGVQALRPTSHSFRACRPRWWKVG